MLETVCEGMYPIDYLFSKDIEEALNKPTHGLTQIELLDLLLKLIHDELVILEKDEKVISTPNHNLIESYINSKPTERIRPFNDQIYFGLTINGGDIWEKFARPNWNAYIATEFDYLDYKYEKMAGTIICGNRLLLDGYLESISYYNYNIEPDSIILDTVEPWEATYWKQLPKGYRMKFKCTDKDLQNHIPNEPEFYDRLWCRWR